MLKHLYMLLTTLRTLIGKADVFGAPQNILEEDIANIKYDIVVIKEVILPSTSISPSSCNPPPPRSPPSNDQ